MAVDGAERYVWHPVSILMSILVLSVLTLVLLDPHIRGWVNPQRPQPEPEEAEVWQAPSISSGSKETSPNS